MTLERKAQKAEENGYANAGSNWDAVVCSVDQGRE